MSTIDLITQKTGVTFRPASAPAIEERASFYRPSAPSKCIEIRKVRIWPVAYMLQHNRELCLNLATNRRPIFERDH
jgi:hypothetical protein